MFSSSIQTPTCFVLSMQDKIKPLLTLHTAISHTTHTKDKIKRGKYVHTRVQIDIDIDCSLNWFSADRRRHYEVMFTSHPENEIAVQDINRNGWGTLEILYYTGVLFANKSNSK